jgi:hypothetical protein
MIRLENETVCLSQVRMALILPCHDELDIVVERFETGAQLIAALGIHSTPLHHVKQSFLRNLGAGNIGLKP